MIGCLGRVLALGVLAVLIWFAWNHGPGLPERVRGILPGTAVNEESSPELAADALGRYRQGIEEESERAAFTGPELESVLRFEFADRFPSGVSDPTVRLSDGEVVLGLRVARSLLPEVSELERVQEILPDTVAVQLRGTLLHRGESEAAFVIRRIDVASIPIPRRFFSAILGAIGPRDGADLPAEAVAVPLPSEVGSARIDGDRLILTLRR